MNRVCIDIGNTLIKFAEFAGNDMVYFELLEKDKMQRMADYIVNKGIESVIVSSVAEVSGEIFTFFEHHPAQFIHLDHQTPTPVENLYHSKETLGKDRLAAIVGANYLYPNQNVLVIDAGSAITFDLVNAKAQFLGGNISPGIQMRYKALHTFTKRLPLVDPLLVVPFCGKNTTDAIRAGVQMGIIYEMDGTIACFKELYPDLKVLLTGGDNKYFDNKLKSSIFVVSNLVMVGLNQILKYNS